MLSYQNTLNRTLDNLVRPEVVIGGRAFSAFRLCGYVGLALTVVWTAALVAATGLSLGVLAALIATGVLMFLGLAMLTKIVSGEEQLVYYHHEIAILGACALVLVLARQPVLAYLDISILGVGAFLFCGRIGCLMVGCCHGRPSRWGVCYGDKHARAGFTHYYVGVRLIPVQFLESLWALSIVIAGSLIVLSRQPAGSALAWYILAYDLGRFGFEFVRGDPDRPYHKAFSEAQWISLALSTLVLLAEVVGVLPPQGWHVALALALYVWAIAVVVLRRRRAVPTHALLNAQHVHEVAKALELAESGGDAQAAATVCRTSLGIQVSASRTQDARGPLTLVALSSEHGNFTEGAARALAELIVRIKHPSATQFIAGQHAVYHIVMRDSMEANTPSLP